MAQKPRQVRMEQKSALAAMQQLEDRSDEELENETRYKAAAQAILGARAAERYDGPKARRHFQKAIAAARPQERMQLRRMAEASLALADRDSKKLEASMARMGQEAPSKRQLFLLQLAGLIAPPKSAGMAKRVRGILLVLLIIALVFLVGFGIAALLLLPFGSASGGNIIGVGILVVIAALVTLFVLGRKRQAKARLAAKEKRQGPRA